ncbi:MAG: hypothetical protein HYW63_04980 [Candidatus Levybacteria bacterium]|nr:hypothetical protein [Candidatus Levybacteria bacterium]
MSNHELAPRPVYETGANTRIPFPVEKQENLSSDLIDTGRFNPRRAGVATALALATAIGTFPAVLAQDNPDQNPESITFNLDLDGDGTVDLGEFVSPYLRRFRSIAEQIQSAVAKAEASGALNQNQENIKNPEEQALTETQDSSGFLPSFNESTRELQRQIFNQENDSIRAVTFEQLQRGLIRFYRIHGDYIVNLDIPGWPLLTRGEINGVLARMKNGTSYSRQLASEEPDENKRQAIIDGARLVAAEEAITDLLFIHDVATNPRLKAASARAADLTADYILGSVDTHGSIQDKSAWIEGAIDYNTRNWRYKVAYAPVDRN